MKIVICGPPHSGKSVFVANLEKYLPAGSYFVDRINKDGEGTWSNNPDTAMTAAVRVKGTYDENFIIEECERLKNMKKEIILVDIGGKLLPDKAPVFKTCDSFIIISNNQEYREKWKEFGESYGSTCIASLLSIEHGTESIESTDGIIRGTIANLERSTVLKGSKLLRIIADMLVKKSGYRKKPINDSSVIDFTDYNSAPPSKALDIYYYAFEKGKKLKSYKVYEARTNWISAIACKALRDSGIQDAKIYDMLTDSYVSIVKKPVKPGISSCLKYEILESERCVFIDFHPPMDRKLTMDDLENLVLPAVNEEKILYISGKLPHWITNTIALSYSNRTQYLWQPGKTFVCIESENISELGTEKTEPEGINTRAYFVLD